MQLPSSENPNTNNEPAAELRQEVEQLSDIASNIAIDSEMEAKIQSLLAQIKKSLREQQLSIEMQRELARLLSLMSKLNYRNPQQVYILDLAISILLENHETSEKSVNSNSPNHLQDKSCRNLVFIKEARRQIAVQSQEYPNPFSSIIKGTGGAYNRLLSGLSWFFIIFVICPIISGGLILAGRDLINYREKGEKYSQVEPVLKELVKKQNELDKAYNMRDELKVRLKKVDREIESIKPQLEADIPNSPISEENIANNQVLANVKDIENFENEIKDVRDKLIAVQSNIDSELKSVEKQEANVKERNSETVLIEQQNLDTLNPGTQNIKNQQINSISQDFFESTIFYILVAVSMGALGSAVSIIVRYNKFIEQSKEGESDLFFTGFFRPIVGMSFAIFAVELIESGVFSGIFTITKQQSRTVYLYMSIAFIAGFSERLVEDVVIKTENTLTGFSSTSDK
ncbi:hypothetical protein NIES267_19130 [Calothrix parasitica NIES-267]|uniref:Uncharacterized protein n=1 Tax=Calothrix parasitica NIES-267 TaxID=1973488 RepID=A0A1Z4LMI4_9CYAN|nr:hypothetical protein NIES267_19130 [Calothrix parasitica NIES-267]